MAGEKCEECKYWNGGDCIYAEETGEICKDKSGWDKDDSDDYVSEFDKKSEADDRKYHEKINEPD